MLPLLRHRNTSVNVKTEANSALYQLHLFLVKVNLHAAQTDHQHDVCTVECLLFLATFVTCTYPFPTTSCLVQVPVLSCF